MSGFAVSRTTVRRRIIVVFMLTVVFTLLLIGRLAWIQIVQADQLYEQAWNQWNQNVPVRNSRGAVYDRQGRLLTGNTPAATVAAIPPQVIDRQMTADALAPVLNLEASAIVETVSMKRSAVYIKRKVSAEVAETVREMNLPGIIFFNEERRTYPGDNLASQVLGFVGTDQGWAGLELQYEGYLSGGESRYYYLGDERGRQLPHEFSRLIEPPSGLDLYLGLDETIQHIVERELDRIMVDAAPQQAIALAVDPHTGAILAAASRPDYNPGNYDAYDPEYWDLKPVTSSFEPGSTFKMITLAAAIEEGLFDAGERHYCAGHITVSGRRIHCWTAERGGHGDISFFDSLGASCNTAFIVLGERLGKETLFSYIRAFGFGKDTGVDYPGESSGLVFDPALIGPVELATTSFGQGVAVTPLQQVMAIAAIANGGYLYKPYLVAEMRDPDGSVVYQREPEVIRQVISEDTARQLCAIMESVFITGTGATAALEGYRLAGKTGTAEKVGSDGAYMTESFIYSLVGFAPLEDPRVVLYVAVDGITRGPRFGSQTSAPLFKRIMEDTLQYLQVSPSEIAPLMTEEGSMQ